jgi:hypothetical protein
MPEVAVAERLRAAGANDIEVRLFITFTAAMDRARDADRLWYSSCRLFLERRWIFDPPAVANRDRIELVETLRQYGVSQRHRVDCGGWRVIAETLSSLQSGPIHVAIYDGSGDAVELLGALQGNYPDGRPRFPLLRGPKIGPMWVRMLAYPGAAAIRSIDVLPVAVDVQVRKVTEYLGVTNTRGQDLEKVRTAIQAAWREDVRLNGATGPAALANTCAALDPALWFLGKWGCTRCEQAGRKAPVADVCSECRFDEISSPRQPTKES